MQICLAMSKAFRKGGWVMTTPGIFFSNLAYQKWGAWKQKMTCSSTFFQFVWFVRHFVCFATFAYSCPPLLPTKSPRNTYGMQQEGGEGRLSLLKVRLNGFKDFFVFILHFFFDFCFESSRAQKKNKKNILFIREDNTICECNVFLISVGRSHPWPSPVTRSLRHSG